MIITTLITIIVTLLSVFLLGKRYSGTLYSLALSANGLKWKNTRAWESYLLVGITRTAIYHHDFSYHHDDKLYPINRQSFTTEIELDGLKYQIRAHINDDHIKIFKMIDSYGTKILNDHDLMRGMFLPYAQKFVSNHIKGNMTDPKSEFFHILDFNATKIK